MDYSYTYYYNLFTGANYARILTRISSPQNTYEDASMTFQIADNNVLQNAFNISNGISQSDLRFELMAGSGGGNRFCVEFLLYFPH